MKIFTWNPTSWFTRAVDYFKKVIYIHEVNWKESSNTRLFYESVNDFVRQAMKGRGETLVAQAGEIEVVSADDLCQSFSTANQRKGSSQRLLNRFMVMSVLSYVDFYRPRYAFPKNVLDMAKCDVHGKEENVFAQTICGLVNRFFCLDAWSFDSPRSRTRVFISITAPGLHHYSIHPRHMHTQTGRAVQMTVPRVVTRGWEGGFIAACPGRAVQMPGFRIITRDWEKGFTAACPGRAVQKPSQVVT